MFTDKIEVKDFPKMTKEYQELLIRVIRIQADCEIGGPQMYVNRWLLGAPTADDQWKVAKTVAEEVDHFRKMNRLLNELGHDAADRLHIVDRSIKYVDAFKEDMESWAEMAVFGLLIDRVGRYQLEEFINCSYLPLARLLPPYDSTIIDEENGHVNYGMAKIIELSKTSEGKETVQKALNKWYPIGLDMFGKSDSWRDERYIYWGIKRRTNDQARREYIAEVSPIIGRLGFVVPDEHSGRKFL